MYLRILLSLIHFKFILPFYILNYIYYALLRFVGKRLNRLF